MGYRRVFMPMIRRLAGIAFLAAHAMAAGGGALDVVEAGARGDARKIQVATKAHSPVVRILSGHSCSKSDLGKIVMIYGAGAATTATNNQDYLGKGNPLR